jgi:hypothetical protein
MHPVLTGALALGLGAAAAYAIKSGRSSADESGG